MNTYRYYKQNKDLISSDRYRTFNNFNYNWNLISSRNFEFYFYDTKFLWKELMKINTRYIEKNKNLSMLEPYVENILYSRLYVDDVDILSNEYIIQLVTLLQLTGQYLVYSQQKLELEIQELEGKILLYENNCKSNEELQILIDDLNRQNKEKDFVIKMTQNLIKNGYNINIENDNKNIKEYNNINLRSKKDELKESKKIYYYCKICKNKKFKTQQYLDEHMQRRHYDYNDDNDSDEELRETKENYARDKKEFDEKLNTMKEYFENVIKRNQEINNINILNMKIDDISHKMISHNKNNQFENGVIQNGICTLCHGNKNHSPQIIIDDNLNRKRNSEDLDKNINIKSSINKNTNINVKEKTNIIIDNTIIKRNIKDYKKNYINNEDYKNSNDNYKDNNKKNENNKQINLIEQKKKPNLSISITNEILLPNSKVLDYNEGKAMFTNKGDEENNKKIEDLIIKKVSEQKEIDDNKNNFIDSNPYIILRSHRGNIPGNKESNQQSKQSFSPPESESSNTEKKNDVKNSETTIKKNPKKEVNSFYELFKSRDNKYKGYVDDYKKIQIPKKFKGDNEYIKMKVDEKIGDPNYINEKFVDNLISKVEVNLNDNDNKYENCIYKALDLGDILAEYKKYKNKNENNQNQNQNNISNNNKQLSQNESNKDKNNDTDKNNDNGEKINDDNNNNMENKNKIYYIQSSTNINAENLEQPKQSIKQSVVIGHDLSQY